MNIDNFYPLVVEFGKEIIKLVFYKLKEKKGGESNKIKKNKVGDKVGCCRFMKENL